MIFNKTLAGLGLAALLMQPALVSAYIYSASLPNGISSGDTTQTSTVLWARSAIAGNVHFQVKDAGSVIFDQFASVTNPLIPAKLLVTNLSPGKQYTFEVTSPDNKLLSGTFRTATAAGSLDDSLSFGVTGDWRGELAPYPAIKNVPAKALDFFIKLGDTIYADRPSPAVPLAQAQSLTDYRNKHEEVYARHKAVSSFANLQQNVSIFSAIDDHEVTNDFAGGALASTDPRFNATSGLINQTTLYNNGLQAFIDYNAIADQRYVSTGDSRFDGRPDLYRAQRYGLTAGVYILDARSFRDKELNDINDFTDPAQVAGFVAQSFDAFTATTRTMLGKQQLDRLKADLLAAEADNVVWKFVVVPEPMQNLGVFIAADRFEGYASERSELLAFIDDNAIKNVVFISADIHGTVINDLTYQRRSDVLTALGSSGNPFAAPQIKTSAFEITTGSVAYEPAFGDTVTGLLSAVPNGNILLNMMFGSVGVPDLATFNALPMEVKNPALQGLMDFTLSNLGYTPIGLQDNNRINASLLKGGNTALFSFGWSRFDIKPISHELKITTYGIAPYTEQNLISNSAEVKSRKPQIVSQLLVKPQL
ncbi:MAG: alkaline phosphatase D family protein [Methylococcaceae bacterium]